MEFTEKISVVMPTYNTPVPFLQEAVESILNQTFRDFEFIIIDDGSTNESVEYLNRIRDKRVRIIRNPVNIGITKSLNIGFKAAKGKYIARMDGDDVSLPERFEKQYAFMESRPDVIVCGTRAAILGAEKSRVPKMEKEDMGYYRIRMLFQNPGPSHPTAFFRHEKLLEHQILYDENLCYAQDYGMWSTVSQYGKVVTMKEVLVLRREHENQISHAHRSRQIECDEMTQKKLLTALLGSVTDEEIDLHHRCSARCYREEKISPEIEKWYDRLIRANQDKQIYPEKKLKKYIVYLKKELIWQTFTKQMTKTEKTALFFRYLPFFSAVGASGEMVRLKIRGLMSGKKG